MFWGLDRDAWISVWSGALGAIPAAVLAAAVAAWVAVRVLNKSNEHQQELSRAAMSEQRRLAELQLAEQRREAAVVRERAAIAALISAAIGCIAASRESWESIVRETALFRSAVIRWQLEIEDAQMRAELRPWGGVMLGASINHLRELAKGGDGKPDEAFEILNEAISVISNVASRWQPADEAGKRLLVAHLGASRESLSSSLEEMMGERPPGV